MHKELHSKQCRQGSLTLVTFVAVRAVSFNANHSGLKHEQKIKYLYFFSQSLRPNAWLRRILLFGMCQI